MEEEKIPETVEEAIVDSDTVPEEVVEVPAEEQEAV